MANTYMARCFCGTIELELTGEPEAMGYCHCESCRTWSAGPVNAFTLWHPDAVRIVTGKAHLRQYNKTENSDRKWCDKCGGHVLAGHPALGLTDVYAAIIPDLEFAPEIHVNYGETVLPIRDGLTKMKDFPAEFGGSGETLAE